MRTDEGNTGAALGFRWNMSLFAKVYPGGPDFSDIYARERQADFLAGQILAISDDGTNDYIQAAGD